MKRLPSEAPWHRRATALVTAAGLALAPLAPANPLGEAVRHGNVQFERLDGQLRILQASDRAIIDWESFSIGAGELTEFLQPGSRSAALNRVRGASASAIEGALRANGQVYLINPNGVLIGPGGTIDVGGFVASTLDVGDGEFLAGGDLHFAGASQAGIVNLGSISALDGDVILIAATVENAGSIRAPRGTAALAAGNDVLLAESGAERVFVRGASGSAKADGVTNTGSIEANIAELKAHGGNLYGMAVKNEGRVAATGVTREGGQIFLRANGGPVRTTGTLKARRSDGSGGRITVDSGAEGRTEIGGEVDAKGDAGTGGEIVILGREIDVLPGSLVIADGDGGGGTILIGGGPRGEDPAYSNAETVTVGEGATLSANALTSGNGGRVIVFANDSLTFLGKVAAAGGRDGGDGGFVELSGRNSVTIPDLGAQIDISAAQGRAGTLLLDPIDVSVIDGVAPGVTGSTITDGAIVSFLTSNGNLAITTAGTGGVGNLSLAGNADITWNTANKLTFTADRDILFNGGSVVSSTGAGAFEAVAGRSITLGSGALVSVNQGDLTLSANQQPVPTSGSFMGILVDGATVRSTGSGSLSVTGKGGDSNANSHQLGVRVQNGGDIIGGTSGLVSVIGTGRGAIGSPSYSMGVEVTDAGSSITSNGANVSVTGTGGLSNLENYGVLVNHSGLITAGGAGTVSVTGNGGIGNDYNIGVAVWNGGDITSGGGGVTVNGFGGVGHATLASYGSAGVGVFGSGSTITSGGGNVSVNGTGGTGFTDNFGVWVVSGAQIASGPTGTLQVIGTGGSGTNGHHYGVVVSNPGSKITTSNGTLAVTGFGGTQGLDNHGIRIQNGAEISSTGSGTVSLVGAGGAGNGFGVTISDRFGAGAAIRSTGTGAVSIQTDSFSLTPTEFIDAGANTVSIFQRTNLLGIDLGGADGFGSTLGLSDAELDRISAGLLRIGNANSGNLVVSSSLTHGNSLDLITGAALNVDAGITLTANRNLSLTTLDPVDGTIALSGANAQLHTSGTGFIDLNAAGDLLVDQATLSTSGSGAISLDALRSVQIRDGSSVSVVDGNLTVNANTGAPLSGDFTGIVVDESTLTTTGSGDISLTGHGGENASYYSFTAEGIRISNGSVIASTGTAPNAGSITLHGTGGSGESYTNGITIQDYGTAIESAVGGISLTGFGGDSDYGDSSGIGLYNDAEIRSIGSAPGAATITLTGTGGGIGWNNVGVEISGWSTGIHSAYGNISITGTGGGDGSDSGNRGVELLNISETIESTGTGPGAATITIHGTGGVGSGDSDGVALIGDVTVSSVEGDIVITGFGGSGDDGGNQGVSLNGDVHVTGSGLAGIAIEGTGGTGGDDNDGVRLDSPFSLVETVDGDLSITGTGGGGATSRKNRGIRVLGTTVRSAGTGALTMIGHGGSGVSENDGIQAEDFALIAVKDGQMTLEGTAGGSHGMGVFAAVNNVGIRSTGTGGISILGDGQLAPGVSLSSATAALGGANAAFVTVESVDGNLVLSRSTTAAGDVTLKSPAETRIGGTVLSANGNIAVEGNQVFVDAPLTATNGSIDFTIDDLGTASSGTIRVNHTLTAGTGLGFTGGTGTADTVTYAGYGGAMPIAFKADDLAAIEFLIGQGPGYTFHGTNAATTYSIIGENDFSYGGVTVTDFENLIAGSQADRFQFRPAGLLTGSLDGGAGSNTLDFATEPFGSPATVDFQNRNGSGFSGAGQFANIANFVGQGGGDTFIGPDAAATYVITGADGFTFGGTTVTGFGNLTAGPNDDRFHFRPAGSFSGLLDGGEGSNAIDYNAENFGTSATVDYQNRNGSGFTGAGSFDRIDRFVGRGDGYTFIGPDADTLYTITGDNDFTFDGVSVTDFANLTGGAANDSFHFGAETGLTGALDGGGGTNNTLDYSDFGSGVVVNLATGVATAIGAGFSNIQSFTGSSAADTLTGPGAASVFNITGPNSFDVGGVFFINEFESLIGGANDDLFRFFAEGSLTGYIDGGLAETRNTLDYSPSSNPVIIDVSPVSPLNDQATGVGGGFRNVTDFIGSAGGDDRFNGPVTPSTYTIDQANGFTVSGAESFTAAGIETIGGGPAADTFRMLAGGSLGGRIEAGGGADTLNYSAFGSAVAVNLANGTATGTGGFTSIENFVGSAASDTLASDGGNDVFNITVNNGGNVNGSTTFTSFETLNAGAGNDRFNFLNQATVTLVDGSGGTDTLFLNDSNLPGTHTYTITNNRISRNPVYNFAGIEILQLLLGPGNDTVNSGFFGFTQILDGGSGNDTLNLPGVASLDEGNPINNVFHLGFEQPRAGAAIDLGDILQLQLDQQLGELDLFAENDFGLENRFNTGNAGLMQQLNGLGNAFSAATAALIGQAIVISAEGNPYLIFRPFSLDGSGLTPSNLAIAALADNLDADANVELARALELTAGILLFNPDGPYAIDLSGLPNDPAVLAALQESLALAAARELFAALEIPIAVGVTNADGPLSISLDGAAPGQPVIVLLTEQLGDPAFNELAAALAAGN